MNSQQPYKGIGFVIVEDIMESPYKQRWLMMKENFIDNYLMRNYFGLNQSGIIMDDIKRLEDAIINNSALFNKNITRRKSSMQRHEHYRNITIKEFFEISTILKKINRKFNLKKRELCQH
jgi:hypothetical protein